MFMPNPYRRERKLYGTLYSPSFDDPSEGAAMNARKRILIVGGVAGGASCAARARRLSEDAEIIVFERGPYFSSRIVGCRITSATSFRRKTKLLWRQPNYSRTGSTLKVRHESEVVAINRERREIQVHNLQTGASSGNNTMRLVLAPGAAPLRPPLPGIDLPAFHPAARS